ncbi:cyclin-like protein [Xylariaceae sp. FL0804]|nr:cyclin-like protein [Xylariaceae sp. FL0804]
MPSHSSLNIAAKRTALGDRNKAFRPMADSSQKAQVAKPAVHPTSKAAVAKAQENSMLPPPKEAFLQPAQRPAARSIIPSASLSHLRSQAADGIGGRYTAARDGVPKYVYRDSQALDEQEAVQVEHKASRHPPTSRYTIADYPSEHAKAPKEARTSSTEQPTGSACEPSLGVDYVARMWSEMRGDLVYPAAPVAPARAEQRPEKEHYAGLNSRHELETAANCQLPESWTPSEELERELSISTEGPKYPDFYLAEDDLTEAPYLDAIEEMPRRESSASNGYADAPLAPASSLPEPGNAAKTAGKAEGKVVDFQPNLEDLHELSDYDDEDYYDDQGFTTAHSYRSRGDNTTGGVTTVMLPPKLTRRGEAEIDAAKDFVESRRTVEDIQDDALDVSMVAEYGDEIFQYMKELEKDLLPNAHYMDIQSEIQWSMRSVLMDWVIQVHTRFSLLPETLFLTVNYIDRFLSYKVVSLGKLQLVGATAIFVAAKYEEINCPSVQEIVYMVDGGYTIDEILKAERFMLSMLNFELGWPGPMSFLRRISKADDYELETRTLAKYFLEVTIMDERFVASPPSYIAAGSHCLSRLILHKGEWTTAHVHYSGYTYSQLKPLVGMILDCCRIARKHHGAVFDKYSDKRYRRSSLYVEGQLAQGFTLPFQQNTSYHVPTDLLDDDFTPLPYITNHALKMPIPIEG